MSMESNGPNLNGGQPPVLPAKQLRHRSLSHRAASVGSDCAPPSPGLRHPNYDEVFESTDCHAPSCPLHQDLDSLKHQLRFRSDGTPPPVLKKRLVRTLSLPAEHAPPLSPQPPLQMHPHNFDNPLYMLAPVRDSGLKREPSRFGAGTRVSAAPLLPLSQLSFDTSDGHLAKFFANFEDMAAVSHSIQHCHLLFLRDKAQHIEAEVLLKEELSEHLVQTYQPQNFLLDKGVEPKTVMGTVCYSVHSPMITGRTFGLTVRTQTEAAPPTHATPKPLHVNVRHVIAYFQPTGSSMKDPSLRTPALDSSSNGRCATAALPGGGSSEYANYSAGSLVCTVQHLLWRGQCVSLERDYPSATLQDFVRESRCLQNRDCVLYDKRMCFLLLQILQGSQHLYKHYNTGPSLMPSEILLVWPGIEQGKRKAPGSNQKGVNNNTQDQRGDLHSLWDALGCPRVVIYPQAAPLSASQSVGDLIQYCLDIHEGLAALYLSSYRKALLHVASQHKSLHVSDLVSALQVVLWGPAVSLLKHKGMSTVHSWLAMKRALFVMKLAEKGVDQTGLDWEDFLCLQYVAFAEPENVANVTSSRFSDTLAGEWGQQLGL